MIEYEINLSREDFIDYRDVLKSFEISVDCARAIFTNSNQFLLCICGENLYNQFRKMRMLNYYRSASKYNSDIQSKFKESSIEGVYHDNIGVIYDSEIPRHCGYLIDPSSQVPKTIKLKLIRYGNKDI